MKIKKIIVAMSLLISCLGVKTMTAMAVEVANYSSSAAIHFVASSDVTLPVDPENPGNIVEPVDPSNPIAPGTAGPLSIDFASNFNFGSQVISSQDKTYYALPQAVLLNNEIVERPNYVQVTDNRGTEAGWTLKVRQNGDFISEEDSTHSLSGALIIINNINIVSASSSAAPSIVENSINLNTSDQTVMAAAVGEGAGTYVAKFGDANSAAQSVELFVPGTITKYAEKYNTTLTWTLSDTPGNN